MEDGLAPSEYTSDQFLGVISRKKTPKVSLKALPS